MMGVEEREREWVSGVYVQMKEEKKKECEEGKDVDGVDLFEKINIVP